MLTAPQGNSQAVNSDTRLRPSGMAPDIVSPNRQGAPGFASYTPQSISTQAPPIQQQNFPNTSSTFVANSQMTHAAAPTIAPSSTTQTIRPSFGDYTSNNPLAQHPLTGPQTALESVRNAANTTQFRQWPPQTSLNTDRTAQSTFIPGSRTLAPIQERDEMIVDVSGLLLYAVVSF